MIRRIVRKLFRKEQKVDLETLLNHLVEIRKSNDVLALYPSPTENNWLGIANATKGLYPNNALEIPQWYSNQVLTDEQIGIVCEKIRDLQFQTVILSGFPPYFLLFAEFLHSACHVQSLFHGTISEFHEPQKRDLINKMLQLALDNKIKSLGFVKIGLAEVFKKLYHVDAYHQPLVNPTIPENIEKISLDKNKFHIGVFGGDTFNKNLHNQVIHALMLDNTVVHVLDKSIFAYLRKDDRILEHGKNLPREVFLSILGSMDVNLYMSYNESWGLVAYESEAMGVPALKMDDVNYLEKIKSEIEKSR